MPIGPVPNRTGRHDRPIGCPVSHRSGERGSEDGRVLRVADAQLLGGPLHDLLHGQGVRERHDRALRAPRPQALGHLDELVGVAATEAGTGLDRYWRDARTLTLHDPVAHKAVEVGDRLLTGAAPVPSAYS